MAVFIAPQKDIQVNHDCVDAILTCMKRHRMQREEILDKYDLLQTSEEWHCFQKWLDAFKELSISMGERNLFLTGMTFMNKLDLPEGTSLLDGLKFINIAYHSKHRFNGELLYNDKTNEIIDLIGNYTIVDFNEKKGEAIITSNTPYPSKFDEGLIYEVTRQFKPDPTRAHLITLSKAHECRDTGGESCTYILSW